MVTDADGGLTTLLTRDAQFHELALYVGNAFVIVPRSDAVQGSQNALFLQNAGILRRRRTCRMSGIGVDRLIVGRRATNVDYRNDGEQQNSDCDRALDRHRVRKMCNVLGVRKYLNRDGTLIEHCSRSVNTTLY